MVGAVQSPIQEDRPKSEFMPLHSQLLLLRGKHTKQSPDRKASAKSGSLILMTHSSLILAVYVYVIFKYHLLLYHLFAILFNFLPSCSLCETMPLKSIEGYTA